MPALILSVTAFAQSARPRPSPSPAIGPAILEDSTGKQIGPFEWTNGLGAVPTVVLKISDLWLAVAADVNGFRNGGGYFYYVSNDCTGTALYQILGAPVVGSSFSAAGTLYYADPRLAQNYNQISSRQNIFFDGTLAGCEGISTSGPIQSSPNLDSFNTGFCSALHAVSERGPISGSAELLIDYAGWFRQKWPRLITR